MDHVPRLIGLNALGDAWGNPLLGPSCYDWILSILISSRDIPRRSHFCYCDSHVRCEFTSIYIYVCICICIFIYIVTSESIYLCICLSIYLPIYLSICVCVCMFVCLYVCMYAFMPLSLNLCMNVQIAYIYFWCASSLFCINWLVNTCFLFFCFSSHLFPINGINWSQLLRSEEFYWYVTSPRYPHDVWVCFTPSLWQLNHSCLMVLFQFKFGSPYKLTLQ
jgi:hypothetical protein